MESLQSFSSLVGNECQKSDELVRKLDDVISSSDPVSFIMDTKQSSRNKKRHMLKILFGGGKAVNLELLERDQLLRIKGIK